MKLAALPRRITICVHSSMTFIHWCPKIQYAALRWAFNYGFLVLSVLLFPLLHASRVRGIAKTYMPNIFGGLWAI